MRQTGPIRSTPAAFALLAVAVIALWQWAGVTANYGGNWTALFCTGALQRLPPLTASERIYVFPNSTGYDGQLYHYIAHDPFLRSGLKAYFDDPRLRYNRILIPFLAYTLALGHSNRIDPAYELVCLLSLGLGVYWSCRFAQSVRLPPAWGLLFLAMPATVVTMDRLVVDGGLAALTAAFLYYGRAPSWKLFLVLLCAALTRETGILLALAYCAHLLSRRAFRLAAVFLMALAPAFAWYGYVSAQTIAKPSGLSPIPLSSILWVLRNPWEYPAGVPFPGAVVAADFLALAGVLLAFGLAFRWFARAPTVPLRIAAMLFAATSLVLQRAEIWQNVYAFGRIYTPLLLCLSALATEYRNPWLLLPLAMMLPRLAIQLAPQALGVLRWIS